MLNAQEVRGHWNELKGMVKEKWGQLTDDDLQIIGGNVDELVGRIQQKTGVAREQVERFIGDLAAGTTSTVERASERMREGYERVGERVRENPAQSMLAVFGMGVVAGVVLALVLRSD